MKSNVNEIRLAALLFDVTVAFSKRGREPGAKGHAQGDKPAGSKNFCPSSPIQQQTQQTVGRGALPRKKKLNQISLLVALMVIAVDPARGQDVDIPAGSPDAGAIVFKKCMACHQIGPNAQNGIAPVLNGVVGRPAGQYPNYSYSSANKNSGLVWDERTLSAYLRAPTKVVPGTKMIFSGLKKGQEISDVIAYLRQFAADGQQNSR